MDEIKQQEMAIKEQEDIFIRDLNELGDWFLQYEYLVQIAAELPRIPQESRTEATRIKGCQTGAWLLLQKEGAVVHVLTDSDSLIIRGILAIAVYLLDGRTCSEIAGFTPRYISETNIAAQISPDRFHGLESAIEDIRRFASDNETDLKD